MNSVVSASTSFVTAKLGCPCHGSEEILSSLCTVWRMTMAREGWQCGTGPGSLSSDLFAPVRGSQGSGFPDGVELCPLQGQNVCKSGVMPLSK